MRTSSVSSLFLAIFLMLSCYSTTAQPFGFREFPTANLTTEWTNNESSPIYDDFTDGSSVKILLLRESTNGIQFACGFYCTGDCSSYLFAIFITFPAGGYELLPEVVWSANRDHPVRHNAILNFTAAGELVLQDSDGSTAWSAGKSVANLTDTGNLVLLDVNNSVVWQSFDHPTDCWLPGQTLFPGQKLKSSVSLTNWTSQEGMFSLQVTNEGLFAYVEANPPQIYSSRFVYNRTTTERKNGSISFYNMGLSNCPRLHGQCYESSSSGHQFRYVKLMPDGHLKVFELQDEKWVMVADLLTDDKVGECGYPLVCGRNSICSANQQCSCPFSYYSAVDDRRPNLGCSETFPLGCNSTQNPHFIPLPDVKYFTSIADMEGVNMETCKQACLNNCSCKAAFFNDSSGECYLPSELFTMISVDPNAFHGNSLAFMKVARPEPSGTYQKSGLKRFKEVATFIGLTIVSSMFLLAMIVGPIIFLVRRRRRKESEEEYLDQLPGMPTRFSYEELETATENFSKKLGQGGFGSVYEGTLEDGSKIAVKCLEGVAHVMKSFLAEIESIGNIHHVNLVKLSGFSAWKSRRLLVYEFMCNGSLDRWIYRGNLGRVLEWECRKKIVIDIARGLAYLHEECRQKIIHLDIKPQNILLDSNFNAKVSDFGLSKLIDRDQSQVMTTIKGTPGYIAPEWWSSFITDKVDVYSFGIVLLEIICGRKIFDRSLPEESWHLLSVLQKCWGQGELKIDDTFTDDMQAHGTEFIEMMKLASWCLQIDFKRRPPMSTVVKVLEGGMDVESDLDYNFTDPRLHRNNGNEKDLTPLLPSVLSGPR